MKHLILGICTLMLVSTGFAGDNKKPVKNARAKTETKAACADPKDCKGPKDCKDMKDCPKACKPACKK